MNAARWNRMAGLFEAALELSPERRGQFLTDACGNDSGLRREIERMLAHEGSAEARLGTIVASAKDSYAGAAEWRIGPFRVIREIGRGGMGVVYLAVRADEQFEQKVAIKLVSQGMPSDLALSRFLRERQVLASLNHHSIARLLDGGSTAHGQPFFAMEYVEGRPITVYAKEERLATEQRLELFCKVCEAVQYAHRNLVVHRDLKPGHILITADGMPKLLDFGIAKALDPDGERPAGATIAILTPEYASPEQVRGQAVTTSTDIYSLGAVLYELLAGSAPHVFQSAAPGELERVICTHEPRKPSVAAAERGIVLPADLDNIVLMALRKEPERRYGSVEQLSQDIRRLLEGRPVMAREATAVYRARKFVGRNRLALAAAAVVLVVLAGGVIAANRQARRAERRFEQVRRLANTLLFDLDDQIQRLPSSTKVRETMVRTALAYLDSLAQESGGERALQFELASAYQKIGDIQGYTMRPNLGQTQPALESHRKALAIASRLAAGEHGREIDRLHAWACQRVGYLLRSSSQSTAALAHFREGLAIAERLYAADPGNPDDSLLLIAINSQLGGTEMRGGGNLKSAAARWRRALEVAQQWAERFPDERSRGALGESHVRLARAVMQAGDLTGAQQHAREAIAILEDLATRDPSNTEFRRDLLNSYEALAYVSNDDTFFNVGDRQTAVTYHRKAVAIADGLSTADPANMTALSDLAIAHRDLCASLVEDDPAGAAHECRTALDLLARLPAWRAHSVVVTSMHLARAMQRLRRPNEALGMLRRAFTAQARTVAADPERTDERLWLLRIHNQIGELLLGSGDTNGAIEEHRQALRIVEELLPSHPEEPELRRDQADCFEGLGRVYAALGERQGRAEQWREARDWYQKSLDVWAHWTTWAASSVFNTRREEAASKAVARCQRKATP